MDSAIKSLALYLPQFHPTPENDLWWGKGFTEWTNVTKAKPLFQNHWQPRLPADLGLYDLRVSEVREAQAQLAKEYGIYGFCYWHYWFAGKRILERPFQEMVKSGKPDFPFCLAWANQTWKGNWHGLSSNKILIEQTYPGEKDYEDHFYSLLDSFHDRRYIQVDGKKLFFIFRPTELPDVKSFINCWQALGEKEGLNGFHMVAMHMPSNWNALEHGYNASVQDWRPFDMLDTINPQKKNLINVFRKSVVAGASAEMPRTVSYAAFMQSYLDKTSGQWEYPLIFSDWDNTPRSGKDGWLFRDFSIENFEQICYKAFESTRNKKPAERIVIIKSWNEWAEGNYMEPDNKYGLAYLETFKKALERYKSNSLFTNSNHQ